MNEANLPVRMQDEFPIVYWSRDYEGLSPLNWDADGVLRGEVRTPLEFAQLPDYGYSLADWATDFASCPPAPGEDADQCHTFDAHMGMLNSSHFVPQARGFYTHYHAQALAKAGECKLMLERLGASLAQHEEFALECTREALIVEAVAQHYLQDAWSVGHMWERWGSPELDDFPGATTEEKLLRGTIVAMTAGLIHGSQLTTRLNDAMCYPTAGVGFLTASAELAGAGDANLQRVLTDPSYAEQAAMLSKCTKASVSQVFYAAGAMGDTGWDPGPVVVDPTSDDCFAQRATNAAMNIGFGEFDGLLSQVLSAPSVWLRRARLPPGGAAPLIAAEYAVELVLLRDRLYRNKYSPNPTASADWPLPSLLGVQRNSDYASSGLPAPYVDRALPWDVDAWDASPSDAERLTRMFHKGHASDWCRKLTRDDLERLRSAAYNGSDARKNLCVELVRRHITTTPDGQVNALCPPTPPLCRLLSGGTAVEIEYGSIWRPAEELARDWCAMLEANPAAAPGSCRDLNRLPRSGGASIGEPHLHTFDRLTYDFQGAGEFVLVRSTRDDFQVQARQRPKGMTLCPGIAINEAVAVAVMGHRVVLDRGRTSVLSVDAEARELAVGASISLDASGAKLERPERERWRIVWPDGSLVQVSTRAYLNIHIVPAAARANSLEGLLGNFNGRLEDDLRVPSTGESVLVMEGTQARVPRAALYDRVAPAFRVTNATSLFDYAPGTNADTYSDPTYPNLPLDLASLSADARKAAERFCMGHVGSPLLEEQCELDVACALEGGLQSGDDDALRQEIARSFAELPAPDATAKTDVAASATAPAGLCVMPCSVQADCRLGGQDSATCYGKICLEARDRDPTAQCRTDSDCLVSGTKACTQAQDCGTNQACILRVGAQQVSDGGRCATRADSWNCERQVQAESSSGELVTVCSFFSHTCTNGICRQCVLDADCPTDKPHCQPYGGCGECASSADCAGAPCIDGSCGCDASHPCPGTGWRIHCGSDRRCGCMSDAECRGSPSGTGVCIK
jgi:hypothetical protein